MSNNIKQRVSVIMGIYNCETTLQTSINSLLEQSFQDFEVVICDDGSDDKSYAIAERYRDKYPDKFTLLKNEKNMGLNYTLNICLKAAKGELIARMDGDDISLPNRFQQEVEFLDSHPNFSIVSSAMIYFDETGDWGIGRPKQTPQKEDLVKGTPFAHAPCMVRKEAYSSVNGYSIGKKIVRVEDHHLWIKMYALGYRGYNIQEPLYKMRDDKNAITRRNFKSRLNEAYIRYLAIKLLRLPFWYSLYVFRPIFIAMMPNILYAILHKRNLQG